MISLKEILKQSASASYWTPDYCKSYEQLGIYLMNLQGLPADTSGMDMRDSFVPFFTNGCFDTIVRIKRGSFKYISCKITDEFKKALSEDPTINKSSAGVQFLISYKKSFHMRIVDLGSPEFIRCQRAYEKDRKNYANLARYIQSGFVEVSKGFPRPTEAAKIRIDRYKERAKSFCAGVLNAEWLISNTAWQSGVISSITFVAKDRQYFFSMHDPKRVYNRAADPMINHEGSRTVINAADTLPELFYPNLRKAFPVNMLTMLPSGIMLGFQELRELFPDEPDCLLDPAGSNSGDSSSETITDTGELGTQKAI